MDEQLRIDTLVINTVIGVLLWAMTLTIAELRFRSFLAGSSGPQIFWIWLPVVFAFGCLLGLAVLRLIPLKHHFHVRKGAFYEDSIGWLGKYFYNRILIRDQDFEPFPANNEISLRPSVWSNAEYRSSFWALQGLVLYGLIGFLVMGLLALPHYFSVMKDNGDPTLIPLAVSILSAGWASLISNVISNAGSKPSNLFVRILALPAGIRNFALGVLVIVMILAIILGMETLLDSLTVGQAYLVAAIALVTLAISGRIVDYNYITPHYFFRDRMADGFMKTEVETEEGQVKTVRDDRQERLNWITPVNCSAPYHIVQTTLNLPGSWHMRFKDRKSDVFTFTKDYCGSDLTDYVSTRIYRGGNTKYSRVIALSGAAVSSAIGYHTFFAQALMTTLLNVRLGLWMTSPAQYRLGVLEKFAKPHQVERRVFWPAYLWDEARAQISARRPLINLTDGEHTGDNLAIYPLLQRRCKVIITGDASADQAGTCTGLFRVLRMAEILLGAKVKINVSGEQPSTYDPKSKESGPAKHHFAIGEITYANGERGWLVHFRPVVTEDDPGSILNYWETHKSDFPHPSTADQFFDDEQYEVQRSLGEWGVEHLLITLEEHIQGLLAAEQEKRRKSRSRISDLSNISTLIRTLLDKQELDFEVFMQHPKIIDEIFESLYSISNKARN